jgi:tetratricopeptide (TPR) repeat protein
MRAAEHLKIEVDPNLYLRRGQAYTTIGQNDLAQADFDVMLDLVRQSGYRHREWEALLELGKAWAGHDYDRTGSHFQQAHNLAVELEDPPAIARSLAQIGYWQVNTGQIDASEASLARARAMFEELGDKRGVA